jgi:hypothetical protein
MMSSVPPVDDAEGMLTERVKETGTSVLVL